MEQIIIEFGKLFIDSAFAKVSLAVVGIIVATIYVLKQIYAFKDERIDRKKKSENEDLCYLEKNASTLVQNFVKEEKQVSAFQRIKGVNLSVENLDKFLTMYEYLKNDYSFPIFKGMLRAGYIDFSGKGSTATIQINARMKIFIWGSLLISLYFLYMLVKIAGVHGAGWTFILVKIALMLIPLVLLTLAIIPVINYFLIVRIAKQKLETAINSEHPGKEVVVPQKKLES